MNFGEHNAVFPEYYAITSSESACQIYLIIFHEVMHNKALANMPPVAGRHECYYVSLCKYTWYDCTFKFFLLLVDRFVVYCIFKNPSV